MTTLLGFSTAVSAQKPVLKGTVVDSKGKPVAGALVNVTETNRLAVTDADGKFALKNAKPGDELCIEGEGFYTKIETAKDDNTRFVLERDSDRYEKLAPLPFTSKKKFSIFSTISIGIIIYFSSLSVCSTTIPSDKS